MNYYKIRLTITPNTETTRDVFAALLADIGYETFVETDTGLEAFISEKLYSEEAFAAILKNVFLQNVLVQYDKEFIESQNWNEDWEKKFFQPIIIDNQVVIHSSFHENVPILTYNMLIDPKMAFGTGHHSTTALMVSYLLELDLKDHSFLDMGCGTAILAILARLKGAYPATAIDNDKWAYENSLENIRLNRVSDIQVKLGDASLLGKDCYDFIFANINRNILLNDIAIYARCMHIDSSLFMSGFYTEDMNILQEECEKNQLKLISYKEKEHWAAMRFIKKS